jgi:hypothetical protein
MVAGYREVAERKEKLVAGVGFEPTNLIQRLNHDPRGRLLGSQADSDNLISLDGFTAFSGSWLIGFSLDANPDRSK